MVTGGVGSPKARLIAYLGAYASRSSFRIEETHNPTSLLVRCRSIKMARRLHNALMMPDLTPVEKKHDILIRSICDANYLVRGKKGEVRYLRRSGPKHTAMRDRAERWLKDIGYKIEHDHRKGIFRRYGIRLADAAMLKLALAPELALVAWDRLGVPW